ncbi:hypothetical protein ABBQ32_006237 [Trebouxia sp. C0010 RCD-2024]
MAADTDAHFGVGLDGIGLEDSEEHRGFSWEKNYPGDEGVTGLPDSLGAAHEDRHAAGHAHHVHSQLAPAALEHSGLLQSPSTHHQGSSSNFLPQTYRDQQTSANTGSGEEEQLKRLAARCTGPRAGGPNGNAPVSTSAHHIGRSSPARAASLRRRSMDDEVEISSGTDTDEDGALIEKARQAAEQKRAAPKKRGPTTGRPRPGGGITLKLLIDEGILFPGENVLTVEYKSNITYGSLAECGRIKCTIAGTELTFESPSAFSIYLKRLINPARKADDGWKTVKFEGKFLEHYKLELARRRFGPNATASVNLNRAASTAAADEPPPAKKPRVDLDRHYSGNGGSPSPRGPRQGPAKARILRPPPAPASPRDAPSQPPPELGEYASGRPRRHTKTPGYRLGSSVEDEHQMVEPEHYRGIPGSGAPDAQPFRIEVTPTAQVMMDFHAHLNMNEVIGLLAGECHEDRRLIRVLRAFPVEELVTEDDTINAEMDPEDVFRVTEHIQGHHQMTVVGWYHSHPTFATFPSMIDIANQVTQQNAHKTSTCEPYIAAIVGPYNKKLPTCQSSMTWFYVAHEPGRIPSEDENPLQAGCTPMQLQVVTLQNPALDAPLLGSGEPPMLTELQALAQRYANQRTRAELGQAWRPGLLRLHKLMASLEAWLGYCPAKQRRRFLQSLQPMLQSAWGLHPPPMQEGAVPVEKGWDQPERAEGEADMKDAGSMGRAQSVGPDTDGQVHHHTRQDGGAYFALADEYAQNDDNASAATGRMTEDEYADSATHSHGSHGMLLNTEQTYKTHNHLAAQESCQDDRSEPSSEGTR